jgi:GntR family transcriptional repressor for pyruvate dehydrogenase complex
MRGASPLVTAESFQSESDEETRDICGQYQTTEIHELRDRNLYDGVPERPSACGMAYDERVAHEQAPADAPPIPSETSGLTTRSADALFPQVTRERRLSDKVADMMLETILSKRLRVGERLPSERELGEQFGVSRTVVREAVRALVAKGIIDSRSGSGLRVAAVDAAAVSESMSLYLRGGEFDFEKVHEVRAVLETHIAGLAAERATGEDVDRIRAVHERMTAESGDVDAAARDDIEFHRLIALATHNELYLVLLDSIGTALLDIRRGNLGSGAAPRTLQEHARVLDAITAHDPASARHAMEAHLDGVAGIWRERSGVKAADETEHL